MKIDYLHGRVVESVDHPGNSPSWNWSIRLEGNYMLKNRDHARTVIPSGIVGSALLSCVEGVGTLTLTFGATQVVNNVATVVPTGTVVMSLNKMTFAGPDMDEIDPSKPDPVVPLPPDPSKDRVATGPTGP